MFAFYINKYLNILILFCSGFVYVKSFYFVFIPNEDSSYRSNWVRLNVGGRIFATSRYVCSEVVDFE